MTDYVMNCDTGNFHAIGGALGASTCPHCGRAAGEPHDLAIVHPPADAAAPQPLPQRTEG